MKTITFNNAKTWGLANDDTMYTLEEIKEILPYKEYCKSLAYNSPGVIGWVRILDFLQKRFPTLPTYIPIYKDEIKEVE